ncbi:MAG: DUF4011 domain-containing protein, partial [Xenococcaceae cyanobacterium MO_188.B29]|nr:DUF4011 domain-containing protein [Xenococcaceae cyanobacterium MO_188.B29]
MLSESAHLKLIQKKIEYWKNNLADLGKRNPLIKFKSDNARTIEILQDNLDWLFKALYKEKKTFEFYIADSFHQPSAQKLSNLQLITLQKGKEQLKRLNKLRLEAQRSLEELGVNSLFLV